MMNVFRVSDNRLVAVKRSALPNEECLENWIAEDPRILGLNILIIGRQVITDFNGRIDLLAIDSEGNLYIIELKRNRTSRDIVAQILDYASWVRLLHTKDIHDLVLQYMGRPLPDLFRACFEKALPEVLNENHNMIIVASEFDPSSSRIVEYLSEGYDIGINAVFFNVFEHNGETMLATDWLLDQQEVVERYESRNKAPWSGYWYANAGDGVNRSWEDMRKYGFLAAGDGTFYSKRLNQLNVGDRVFAYQKGRGYVGFGKVTQSVVPASQFEVNGQPLFSLDLKEAKLKHDADNPELAEYVVGIDWQKTFPLNDARSFPGAFANQNIVCKLRDQATIEFLRREFAVLDV